MKLISNKQADRRKLQYENFSFEVDLSLGDFLEEITIERVGQLTGFCIEQFEVIKTGVGGDVTGVINKIVTGTLGDFPIEVVNETGALINVNVLEYPIFTNQKLGVSVTGDTTVIINIVVSYM